jgi:hypothetical protein
MPWNRTESECIDPIFLTSALARSEWSASRPCRFTPEEGATCTHWTGTWVDPQPVWMMWRSDYSSSCRHSNCEPSVVQAVPIRSTDYNNPDPYVKYLPDIKTDLIILCLQLWRCRQRFSDESSKSPTKLHDVIIQKITVFWSYQIKKKEERKRGNISALLFSYFTVWTASLQRFLSSNSFLTQTRGILQRRIGHS